MRYLAPLTATFFLLCATAEAAPGNAEAGHDLAASSCSGCHTLPSAREGADTAPPFANIARDHKGDRTWVRTWLMNPHPPMKGLNLTRQQIDDINAYLESLSSP